MQKFFGIFIALFLTFSIISDALTVRYASLEKITNDATVILHGKVKSSYCQWEGINIYTYTKVQPFDFQKGQPVSGEFLVKQLGGTVGEISQMVTGSPKLKQDGEVVLFLNKWKNAYWIHSFVLGYFEVVQKEGVKYAVNNFNSVELIDSKTNKKISNKDHIKTSYELSSLFSEIKKTLGN